MRLVRLVYRRSSSSDPLPSERVKMLAMISNVELACLVKEITYHREATKTAKSLPTHLRAVSTHLTSPRDVSDLHGRRVSKRLAQITLYLILR